MSKHDDLRRFEGREARKWTQISDYLPGARKLARAELPPPLEFRPSAPRRDNKFLWLPLTGVAIAAAWMWSTGALDHSPAEVAAATPAAIEQSAPSAAAGGSGSI